MNFKFEIGEKVKCGNTVGVISRHIPAVTVNYSNTIMFLSNGVALNPMERWYNDFGNSYEIIIDKTGNYCIFYEIQLAYAENPNDVMKRLV